MTFIAWKREMDRQAKQYVESRRPEVKGDVLYRYGLETSDYVVLGEIDRAFKDEHPGGK